MPSENSFSYNYSNGTNLIRWNYGIYNTYEEAQKAIEELNKIGAPYYPVIQKVSKEQELYNLNITNYALCFIGRILLLTKSSIILYLKCICFTLLRPIFLQFT